MVDYDQPSFASNPLIDDTFEVNMSLSDTSILIVVGAIFLLVGLFGEGFEISQVKFPSIGKNLRILSGSIGVMFIIIALWRPPEPTSSSGNPVTPTSVVNGGTPVGQTDNQVTDNQVYVTLVSSTTKQDWMDAVVKKFNDSKQHVSDKTIVVTVTHEVSGDSMNAILSGDSKPVAWSPGEDIWKLDLNSKWQITRTEPLITRECLSTVYTPLGIAMWKPLAKNLGWPNQPISWKTILNLASDPKEWEKYDPGEWGEKFKFGHAHTEANAGLLTVASFVYGTQGGLSNDDVLKAYEDMRILEQNTSKYGRTSTALLDAMVEQPGTSYLHAVATFESETVKTNLKRKEQLNGRELVFVVPAEKTFWSNQPYCILDNADWVTPEQIAAAEKFGSYLLEYDQQNMAIDYYLRPYDLTIPLREPLNEVNGADPRLSRSDSLPSPDEKLKLELKDLFLNTKRKATVIVVVDTSESMKDEPIAAAIEAIRTFLGSLDPQDEISIIPFNEVVDDKLFPPHLADEQTKARWHSELENLKDTKPGTALYDAICAAIGQATKLKIDDVTESRLYRIVLLSDGAHDLPGEHPRDDSTKKKLDRIKKECVSPSADTVNIFSIGYKTIYGDTGNGGTEFIQILKDFAVDTGGKYFDANEGSIKKIYLEISVEK